MAIEQGQIFTPDKKSVLIDELKQELNNIKVAMTKGGTNLANPQVVQSSKTLVQNILNDLLSKKGVITPDETDKALEAINESKKARLQSDFYSGIKKSTIYLVAFIAVGVGIYFYTKKRA